MTVAPPENEPTLTDRARTPSDLVAEGAAPGHEGVVLVDADLLVEDVSIDGMCGVY
jgi:mycofactocin precursor